MPDIEPKVEVIAPSDLRLLRQAEAELQFAQGFLARIQRHIGVEYNLEHGDVYDTDNGIVTRIIRPPEGAKPHGNEASG